MMTELTFWGELYFLCFAKSTFKDLAIEMH